MRAGKKTFSLSIFHLKIQFNSMRMGNSWRAYNKVILIKANWGHFQWLTNDFMCALNPPIFPILFFFFLFICNQHFEGYNRCIMTIKEGEEKNWVFHLSGFLVSDYITLNCIVFPNLTLSFSLKLHHTINRMYITAAIPPLNVLHLNGKNNKIYFIHACFFFYFCFGFCFCFPLVQHIAWVCGVFACLCLTQL